MPTRFRRRIPKSGLLLSLAMHLAAIGLLVWMAARDGLMELPLKKVAVNLVREPSPKKPRVPDQLPLEPPQRKSPPFSEAAPAEPTVPIPAKAATSVPQTAAIVAAPAPVDMPSFAFEDGGKTVQTSTDPAGLYRSFVEFSLRSRWNRPTDIADEHYVAEIEIAVDAAGRISTPRWIRKSGDARWDASVWNAVAETRSLNRPPPPGFPTRVTIRFDVIQSGELPLE